LLQVVHQFTFELGSSCFKHFTGQQEVDKQSTLLYNINICCSVLLTQLV